MEANRGKIFFLNFDFWKMINRLDNKFFPNAAQVFEAYITQLFKLTNEQKTQLLFTSMVILIGFFDNFFQFLTAALSHVSFMFFQMSTNNKNMCSFVYQFPIENEHNYNYLEFS